jgi:hypothetical protein
MCKVSSTAWQFWQRLPKSASAQYDNLWATLRPMPCLCCVTRAGIANIAEGEEDLSFLEERTGTSK